MNMIFGPSEIINKTILFHFCHRITSLPPLIEYSFPSPLIMKQASWFNDDRILFHVFLLQLQNLQHPSDFYGCGQCVGTFARDRSHENEEDLL